ncbi:hypothetical protein B0H11DRAFT_2262304 [Mycena galericulata]|nr:hypothetical protein B0H11DRAFT_2262304 [Mycena galericulata]
MATPNHPLIAHVLNSPPSPSDAPGYLYAYRIFRHQPLWRFGRRPRFPRAKIKIRRANNPQRRRREWARQCRGQRVKWWFWWYVPFAKKFERLIHTHFRVHGAWVHPSLCGFCLVRHQEQFYWARCGGKRGVVLVVEGYLGILGWPSVKTSLDSKGGQFDSGAEPVQSQRRDVIYIREVSSLQATAIVNSRFRLDLLIYVLLLLLPNGRNRLVSCVFDRNAPDLRFRLNLFIYVFLLAFPSRLKPSGSDRIFGLRTLPQYSSAARSRASATRRRRVEVLDPSCRMALFLTYSFKFSPPSQTHRVFQSPGVFTFDRNAPSLPLLPRLSARRHRDSVPQPLADAVLEWSQRLGERQLPPPLRLF